MTKPLLDDLVRLGVRHRQAHARHAVQRRLHRVGRDGDHEPVHRDLGPPDGLRGACAVRCEEEASSRRGEAELCLLRFVHVSLVVRPVSQRHSQRRIQVS